MDNEIPMGVGYYDRTARGRLVVSGHDRKDLLHRLAAHDILGLKEGEGRPTCFCTGKGRLIDWAVALDRGRDLLLLCANTQRLSGHIQQYTITEDVSVGGYMAVEIVVCGSEAADLIGVELPPWGHTTKRLGEVQTLVARVEPLMGDAYALVAPDAVILREMLAARAESLDAAAVEHGRVRAGIPAFPNEINEDHNPWEAGLGDSISLSKGCYIGQEVIARLHHYRKVQRRLVGLRLQGPAEPGAALRHRGALVGALTTVAGEIGLGYVHVDAAAAGTELDRGTVVALPMEA
ncbi:MAG: YgfZ/GcvT domain-containing protein [Planctomycetota bacterium]